MAAINSMHYATEPRIEVEVVRFLLPDQKPDVRLKVFNTHEYHVHSAVLKMHSAFFRMFLKSPDKILPASKKFVYEWVTTIGSDEKKPWRLVTAGNEGVVDFSLAAVDTEARYEQYVQQKAFKNILCAMYHNRYSIDMGEEILAMTKLANDYGALRVVSRSLDASLRDDEECQISASISDNPGIFLAAAIKLRNAILFKDCMRILSFGPADRFPWRSYDPLPQERLLNLHKKMHREINDTVAMLQGQVIHSMKSDSNNEQISKDKLVDEMSKALISATMNSTGHGVRSLPSYFRALCEAKASDGSALFGGCAWFLLMGNSLALFPHAKAGEKGEWEEYFLSAFIDDEDLPWDITDEDW